MWIKRTGDTPVTTAASNENAPMVLASLPATVSVIAGEVPGGP